MYLADPETIVLLSEPQAWNVSKDGGATWKRTPYTADGAMPPEYPRAFDFGPFDLDRGPRYEGPTLIRDLGDPGFLRPYPADMRPVWLANERRDLRVWLAIVKDGRPATMVSRGGTRAFTDWPCPNSRDDRSIWRESSSPRTARMSGCSAIRRT